MDSIPGVLRGKNATNGSEQGDSDSGGIPKNALTSYLCQDDTAPSEDQPQDKGPRPETTTRYAPTPGPAIMM